MVIDASVALKLIFDEPGSNQAIELARTTELIGPTLLYSEFANALWRRILNGELETESRGEPPMALLARVVRTVDETPHLPRALSIAIALGHPVYDCVYLAVAEAYETDLLTADSRFVRRVQGTSHADRVKELASG
jgi:predicted nucleic acid-binding protein